MYNLPQLTGTLPSELGSMTEVEILNIVNTSLHGTIPTTLDSIIYLDTLVLQDNQLTGTLPSSLCALTHLTFAVFIENNLTCYANCLFGNQYFYVDSGLNYCPGRK